MLAESGDRVTEKPARAGLQPVGGGCSAGLVPLGMAGAERWSPGLEMERGWPVGSRSWLPAMQPATLQRATRLPSVSTVLGEPARQSPDDGRQRGEPPDLNRADSAGLIAGRRWQWRNVRVRHEVRQLQGPPRLTAVLPQIRTHVDHGLFRFDSAAWLAGQPSRFWSQAGIRQDPGPSSPTAGRSV